MSTFRGNGHVKEPGSFLAYKLLKNLISEGCFECLLNTFDLKTSVKFVIKFIMLALVLPACTSGIIPCPTVKPVKLRESHARQVKKAYHEESPVASARPHHDFTPSDKKDILANKMNVEEWDCPRPGSRQNKKMIRDNKKRMEKRVRVMMKKQHEMKQTDPLTNIR